ncbi:hypothetical protein QP028_04975 [Corynebacterium suedekumii]|nr:hypothetical protein QP028_04975 [Corynebacterium suedekumii]
MRTVPGPATQEVLEALIDPGVTRMEVNSPDTLVLEVWPERCSDDRIPGPAADSGPGGGGDIPGS